MIELQKHHIVIIGGGPGGYEAALAGRQLGAEVTLIERQGIGGNAVLTDVVPSKTLIATAEAARRVTHASSLGVRFSFAGQQIKPKIEVDLGAVNQRLLDLAEEQSSDMLETLMEAGVRIIHGSGRLDGNHHVIVEVEGQKPERLEAKTVIVAVGAHPRTLPDAAPDGERIFNWTQLYKLQELPEHMIVVGSGVTGAEFASAYSHLGAEVSLISSRSTVLPGNDADAAAVIEHVFRANGINIYSESRAAKVVNTGDGVEVTLADGKIVKGSHCLMAVGGIPNTAGLGLEEAGVALNETGHIIVNKVARTSRANVYAVGDCSTSLPLASVSAMQGRTAVFHTMGDVAAPTQIRNVASNVFTAPEIASVGWSEQDIKDKKVSGYVEKIDLATNPRAKMQGVEEGFIKLICSTGGTVIGGVVVAPRASDLIYPIAVAIENRLTVDELANTFTVYPSLSGSISDAARALHQPVD
ncbi:NAD(P)H-quinone dehydrogenase [Candidatus Rhodoluna planktonica]|uniref:Flavoprotein disulfide reductase n=1 Tax=Candidatus Rhodoluna planktonica TaxID=535712 RepID=A0A1D9E051_9MICO|nr:NAD(P)H-quinone dehydrogenase [Candidatus Rhodoluna planktonica]AOY56400.1 flavoprotein disulfide reductase [Candidatus Rhodoluna planktonica]